MPERVRMARTGKRKKKKRLAHTHTHLLHRCAHIPYKPLVIVYCLVNARFTLPLSFVRFSYFWCGWWLFVTCVALMLFLYVFPSFVWLFVCLLFCHAVAVVVFDSRFVSLFLRCTDIYMFCRTTSARTYLHKSGTRASERTHTHRHPLRHKVLCLCNITLTHIRFLW